MAKRIAEDQATREKEESGDRDEDEVDPGVRTKELAPVVGRQIRGMPKRGASKTPAPSASASPAPAPAAPVFGSGFSFGAPAQPSTTPTAPPASNAFSGFSFGAKPAASAPAPAAAPAAPFAGFSFGVKPAAPPVTSTTPTSTPSFSFGSSKPAQPAPAAFSAPSQAASTPFSFGSTSAPAPTPASDDAKAPTAKPPAQNGDDSAMAEDEASTVVTVSSVNANGTKSDLDASPSDRAKDAALGAKSGVPPFTAMTPPAPEVAYYTAVRGLNASIMSFLTSALEKDNFIDLSQIFPGLMEQYSKHLEEAQKEGGWAPQPPKRAELKAAEPEPSKPKFSMPKAPTAGAGFGLPPPPAGQSSSTSSGSGFGFKPAAASSSAPSGGFAFGTFGQKASAPAPTPAAAPKKHSDEVNKLVQDVIDGKDELPVKATENTSTQKFGFSSGTEKPATEPKKTGGLFSFAPSGPIAPPTPDAKSFTPSKTLESPSALGKFGPGGTTPQLAFGGAGSSSGISPSAPKSTGFSFGANSSGSSFSLGSGAPVISPSVPASQPKPAASTFSFGAAPAKPPASSGFSFGQATSSGFAFGGFKPPAASTESAPAPATGGFSFSSAFGQKSDDKTTSGTDEGKADTAGEGSGSTETPAEGAEGEVSQNLAASNVGEENEENVREFRSKLFRLEEGQWKPQGVGVLRIKKEKKDGPKQRRLLLRTDGNGAILLNMRLTKTTAPKADGKRATFSGSDLRGQPANYALMFKTAGMVADFVDAVNAQVSEI